MKLKVQWRKSNRQIQDAINSHWAIFIFVWLPNVLSFNTSIQNRYDSKAVAIKGILTCFFFFFSCSDQNDDRQTLSASCYLLINSDKRKHRTFCLFPHWHFNWDRQFPWAKTRKTLPECVQGQSLFLATSKTILSAVQFLAKSFFRLFNSKFFLVFNS